MPRAKVMSAGSAVGCRNGRLILYWYGFTRSTEELTYHRAAGAMKRNLGTVSGCSGSDARKQEIERFFARRELGHHVGMSERPPIPSEERVPAWRRACLAYYEWRQAGADEHAAHE